MSSSNVEHQAKRINVYAIGRLGSSPIDPNKLRLHDLSNLVDERLEGRVPKSCR